MKMYLGEKELRLVGKAWEIRHTLRKLSRESDKPGKLKDRSARGGSADNAAPGQLQSLLNRR